MSKDYVLFQYLRIDKLKKRRVIFYISEYMNIFYIWVKMAFLGTLNIGVKLAGRSKIGIVGRICY